MTDQNGQTGATPDGTGAMPGATGVPAASGATSQADGTTGMDATSGSADGSAGATSQSYPEGLGDAGKRALDAERDARIAAEGDARKMRAELEKYRKAQQSEAERAIEEARSEGWTKASEMIRRSEVRRALTAAGCRFVDLAARADEFAALEVTDTGSVKDLDKMIDRFRAANPDAFAAPGRPSDSGLGPRGSASPGNDMNALIRRAAGR